LSLRGPGHQPATRIAHLRVDRDQGPALVQHPRHRVGVAGAHRPRNRVWESVVVVPAAPGGRFRKASRAPAVSDSAIMAQPCLTPEPDA
jgi:hypothetical protein